MIAHVFYKCGVLTLPAVLGAIIAVESKGDPYALNVNGDVELVRAPGDYEQAVAMARWLERHGYSFDAGLAQVNSTNFAWLGLTVESVFEPCTNLRAAARVLEECQERATVRFGPGRRALAAAVSCYNTGDFARGVLNGYVGAVLASAAGALATRPVAARAREGEPGESRGQVAHSGPEAFARRSARRAAPDPSTTFASRERQ